MDEHEHVVVVCFFFFPPRAACQCHSHATDCYYDAEVERRRASLNIHGRYDGGGVCINCQVGILKSKKKKKEKKVRSRVSNPV